MGCYPDKPALIDADTDETLSFSQLKSTVLKLSHAFLDLGVNRTDRVMIFAPNSIHFPLGFFDVTAIGAISTMINPLYFLHELSKQVKYSIPKLVVTVPELLNKVKGVVLTLEFHCSGFDGNHGSRTCEEYASGLLVCIFNVPCVNIEKYRITHLWVVHPIVLAMAKQIVVNKFDLSLVRQIGYGTTLLRKEMMEDEDIRSVRLGYCGVQITTLFVPSTGCDWVAKSKSGAWLILRSDL
ncbi:lactoylglutathione lyase-like [Hibiscus syriacus]|uniref:Lactoylglutathione lyase-like n=1 Tax=Hibiscus syriacus TaxID=106335 RepID=A0A6A2WMT5_HIBSY|nr:lactoylglutathione lyase-like [Hibiscus syriacus]